MIITKRTFLIFSAFIFALTIPAKSQTPPTLSHVERFSTPEARALKIERETTEKIQKEPNNAVVFNERGSARSRLQKYKEALEDFRRAVELDSKNADFRANLGYVLWKLGKADEAVAAEREALKLDDKNFTANFQLGRFLLRTGNEKNVREAAEKLKKAIEIDPRQYEIRFELIAAYRHLNETAAALAQLDILQEALPSNARVNYVSALLQLDRKDFKSAVEAFREALRKDENLPGARQDLGLVFIKRGEWSEAEKTFDELARRQADSPTAAYFHALTLYNLKKLPEAEAEARRALRLDATLADAHILLGIILTTRENSDAEAIESLSQAAALSPANFDAVFYLGRVQYLSKNYTEAVKNLRSAVNLNKTSIEARFFLGSALEAVGDSDAALAEYSELSKLDAKSEFGLIGLGVLQLKKGNTNEAINSLKNAVAVNDKNFEANWALGRAFFLKEDFTSAEEFLKKAVEIAPNRTDARYQLGLTLRRLGKTEEAAKEFALVEQINKEFREGTIKGEQ